MTHSFNNQLYFAKSRKLRKFDLKLRSRTLVCLIWLDSYYINFFVNMYVYIKIYDFRLSLFRVTVKQWNSKCSNLRINVKDIYWNSTVNLQADAKCFYVWLRPSQGHQQFGYSSFALILSKTSKWRSRSSTIRHSSFALILSKTSKWRSRTSTIWL